MAASAERDGIFSRFCQYMKFMGKAATHSAGICQHRAVIQAEAIKDMAIGAVHGLVGLLQRLLRAVE